ncbi:MAG: response regulator [Bryobacteraceae bacterium]
MSKGPDEPTFRIVLLEDNPADVYLLRKALDAAGMQFELTVIENGAEGLAFARREGVYAASPIPDLAVLDLNVPKGGGVTVLGAMRRSKELEFVPVVIMTSSATPREQATAGSLGVQRFITKPTDLDEFMEIGGLLKEILLKAAVL